PTPCGRTSRWRPSCCSRCWPSGASAPSRGATFSLGPRSAPPPRSSSPACCSSRLICWPVGWLPARGCGGSRLGGGGRGLAALATPYALLHARSYLEGVRIQMDAHYKPRPEAPSFTQQIAFYLGVLPWSFGPLGVLLLLAGLGLALREWRSWGPLIIHPFTTLAVLATAELHYERHLVPTTGVLALLAGRAVAWLAERTPPLAGALIVAAA